MTSKLASHVSLRFTTVAAFVSSIIVAASAHGETIQDRLYKRAQQSTKCDVVPNNGRYCTYSFGKVLTVGIKDVGGSDTVVGFHNSNIENEFYAVLYAGCVVIVPGKAHAQNYDRDYGVSISPKTGLVYRTTRECTSSL